MEATKAASGCRKPGVFTSCTAVAGYVSHRAGENPAAASSFAAAAGAASRAARAAAAEAEGGVGGSSWKSSHVRAVAARLAAEMAAKYAEYLREAGELVGRVLE